MQAQIAALHKSHLVGTHPAGVDYNLARRAEEALLPSSLAEYQHGCQIQFGIYHNGGQRSLEDQLVQLQGGWSER